MLRCQETGEWVGGAGGDSRRDAMSKKHFILFSGDETEEDDITQIHNIFAARFKFLSSL